MKTNTIVIAILGLQLSTAFIQAESPAERQAKDLKDQRDKAVASATKTINDRYQASLEQLLNQAMQVKDAAGIESIKAELLTLGPLRPPPLGSATPAPGKIPAAVIGSWKVNDATGWTATFEFKPEGTCSITPGTAQAPDAVLPCSRVREKIQVLYPDGKIVAFDFPPKAGKMDGYKPDGSKLWANKIH